MVWDYATIIWDNQAFLFGVAKWCVNGFDFGGEVVYTTIGVQMKNRMHRRYAYQTNAADAKIIK